MKIPITIASCLLVALMLTAAAQDTEAQDWAKQWASLRDATLKLADNMPADKYSFRPSNGDPSFAELLLKMADSIDSHFAEVSGQKSSFVRPETLGADTVKKLVGESFDRGAKTIGSLQEGDVNHARAHLLAALTEASETRGQAEAYLKTKDMVTAEEVDRRKFLFYGFLAAWLLVCLYVVAVSLRERRLRGELDRVKRLVEDREHDKPGQVRL
jgi:hypothetical protein